jgi:hypothetical protein
MKGSDVITDISSSFLSSGHSSRRISYFALSRHLVIRIVATSRYSHCRDISLFALSRHLVIRVVATSRYMHCRNISLYDFIRIARSHCYTYQIGLRGNYFLSGYIRTREPVFSSLLPPPRRDFTTIRGACRRPPPHVAVGIAETIVEKPWSVQLATAQAREAVSRSLQRWGGESLGADGRVY